MGDGQLTIRDSSKQFPVPTGQPQSLTLQRFPRHTIELDGIHFHTDSAVMLPAYMDPDAGPGTTGSGDSGSGAGGDSGSGSGSGSDSGSGSGSGFGTDKASALSAVATALSYAKAYPDKKLLDTGHADTTGSAAYNFTLTDKRSKNVLAVLQGKADDWASSCMAKHQVEDVQLLLKWAASKRGYGCDPGAIDNQEGPHTDQAITNFKHAYNAEFSASLTEDSSVGTDLFTAFFALYDLEIRAFLSMDADTLASVRSGLTFVQAGSEAVGCGKSFPIEAPDKDNFSSDTNRRVELIFFDPGQEPKLDCHSGSSCQPTQCEVFNPRLYKLDPIPIGPVTNPANPEIIVPGGQAYAPAPAAGSGGDSGAAGGDSSSGGDSGAAGGDSSASGDSGASGGDASSSGDSGDGGGDASSSGDSGDGGGGDSSGVFAADDADASFGSDTGFAAAFDFDDMQASFGSTQGRPIGAAPPANTANAGTPQANQTPPTPPAKQTSAPPPTGPVITTRGVVLVKKSYMAPKRQPVTLKVNDTTAFSGTGTLKRTGNAQAVNFFKDATSTTAIQFDGKDNVFQGTALTAGVQVFVEGVQASGAVDDVTLTLTLDSGSSATATLTAVELTLDICKSRTAKGTDPAPLDQPPPAGQTPPNPATDKVNGGRFLAVAADGNKTPTGRAMIIVRPVKPAAFKGKLVLSTSTSGNGVFTLYANETPSAGEQMLDSDYTFGADTIPAGGLKLWIQGFSVSSAFCDAFASLGVDGLEKGDPQGDKVCATLVQIGFKATVPSTPPLTVRTYKDLAGNPFSNADVAKPQLIDHATNILNTFYKEDDDDPTWVTNLPLVLVADSLAGQNVVEIEAVTKPSDVPIFFSVTRAKDDAGSIAALGKNPLPTLTWQKPPPGKCVDKQAAKLSADAVGSFYVRAYVDCNGQAQFDETIDRQPNIPMRLVLVHAKGTVNSSTSFPGGVYTIPSTPTAKGFAVKTGDPTAKDNFKTASVAGVHNDAKIELVGGGADGTRGLRQVFAGWIQNIRGAAIDVSGDYGGGHKRTLLWNNDLPNVTVAPASGVDVMTVTLRGVNVPAAGQPFRTGTVTNPLLLFPTFLPSGYFDRDAIVKAIVWITGQSVQSFAGPVLDVTTYSDCDGQGGNTASGAEGGSIDYYGRKPTTGPASSGVGQEWEVEQWDSPSYGFPAEHSTEADLLCKALSRPWFHGVAHGIKGALASARYNLDFRTDLCLWTTQTLDCPGVVPSGKVGRGNARALFQAGYNLYSTVVTNQWTVSFQWPAGAANGITLKINRDPVDATGDSNPPLRPARPVEGVKLECYFPTGLRVAATDAST